MATKLAKVTIDGVSYDIEKLSRDVKNLLTQLRAADEEIRRVNRQLGLMKTARSLIAATLKQELGKNADAIVQAVESKGD